MLDLMRRHAKSWIIKVALFGIIIVFALFFGWSGPRKTDPNIAAKINDEIITYNEFDYERRMYRKQLNKRFGGALTPEVLKKLNIEKTVIDTLIARRLFRMQAEKLGLMVTDEDLKQDIANNPNFQANGVFNNYRYSDALRDMNLTSADYENLRKKQLIGEQFIYLVADSVKTDPREIRRFWHFQNDKLSLSYLILKPDKQTSQKEPDKAELEAYFNKNQVKYEIPASVDFEYVAFSWRDIQKKLTVSGEEVQNYFANNPGEFVIPEKARVRHILLKVPPNPSPEQLEETRKKIEELKSKIEKGENFEDLARSKSEDKATADKGGDLGEVTRGALNPDLEQVIFSLDPKKVSDPVRTSLGFHLVLVDEKTPEREQKLDEVKDAINKKLLEEKARRKAEEDSEAFYEKVYRTEDLTNSAQEFGLEVKKAESVTSGWAMPDVGADSKIITEAFELSPGQISKLVRSGDYYVLMKLLNKTESRIPEFDEVRNKVKSDYVGHLALQDARKKAEEIIQDLKKNPNDAEAIAKKYALSWTDVDPVSRVARFVPKLGDSPEVKEVLTAVTKGDPVFPNPIPVKEGVAIVRLNKIQTASNEKFTKESDRVSIWIQAVRKEEFVRGWMNNLKRKAELEINDKLL